MTVVAKEVTTVFYWRVQTSR